MSQPTSDPVSHIISAALSVVGSWTCPVLAEHLHVVNQGTGDVYITVDGPAPTVGGNNEFFLPAGDGQAIDITVSAHQNQSESPSSYTGPLVQAISAAALSIFVQVA